MMESKLKCCHSGNQGVHFLEVRLDGFDAGVGTGQHAAGIGDLRGARARTSREAVVPNLVQGILLMLHQISVVIMREDHLMQLRFQLPQLLTPLLFHFGQGLDHMSVLQHLGLRHLHIFEALIQHVQALIHLMHCIVQKLQLSRHLLFGFTLGLEEPPLHILDDVGLDRCGVLPRARCASGCGAGCGASRQAGRRAIKNGGWP
mmetsp:Transcript_18349/g.31089  ORF Transcript_18349/g.31089 Transcript_18349/m.31089 type:complete len:203 (-) Transcript_18349:7-615(-)